MPSAAVDPRAMAATTASPHIYLSAGEPSGDEYAADLLASLFQMDPALTCVGMGGNGLRQAGAEIHTHIEGLTAMGLAEVVTRLPAHYRAMSSARTSFSTDPPDVAVLVDYPSFHLRVARVLKKSHVPVIQFVSPKFWAWRPSRSRAYRGVIDHCATIFPFEPDFLAKLGISATFVGHPIMDVPVPEREEARARLGVPDGSRMLALFPGSRGHEVGRMWRTFRDAAVRVRQAHADVHVVVAGVTGANYPGDHGFMVARDDSRTVMAAADALLGKSGTSNLLAARLRVPMVVAHAVHPVTYAIARRLIRTPHVSPVNIVAGRKVVPELIQSEVNVTSIAAQVIDVLENQTTRLNQVSQFDEITSALGPFSAVDRVAEMAIERCGGR